MKIKKLKIDMAGSKIYIDWECLIYIKINFQTYKKLYCSLMQ